MLTVVMPAYNEEAMIEGSVREWHEEVISRLPGSVLVVVDDCSTDGTLRILESLAARLPALRVVRMPQNGGHGRALRHGFRHAAGEYVFQTDSDRQHLAREFWSFWELRRDYDFIFGVRRKRADGALRALISRVMRWINFLLWGVRVKDANCPFKLMQRPALEAVLRRIPEDCFIPMVAVSLLARKLGWSVVEVPVTHAPRRGGTPSVKGLLRWARVGALCVRQLAALRLATRGASRASASAR